MASIDTYLLRTNIGIKYASVALNHCKDVDVAENLTIYVLFVSVKHNNVLYFTLSF